MSPIPIAAEVAIMAGAELGKALLQAYAAWTKQQGMTKEEGIAHFNANYEKFMVVSEQPVEPVKET
jgi:hypothetical protein